MHSQCFRKVLLQKEELCSDLPSDYVMMCPKCAKSDVLYHRTVVADESSSADTIQSRHLLQKGQVKSFNVTLGLKARIRKIDTADLSI